MNDSSKVSLGLAIAERKIVWLCAGWALCSMAVLIVTAVLPSAARSASFGVALGSGTDVLKAGAFGIATALCWRNAKDSSIISGQIVWQAIAIGLGFHTLGDTTTLLWHLLWGAATTVALSAVFYGASYLFLAIGLFNAVLPRQTSLTPVQSLGVAVFGVLGILLASWINFYMPVTLEANASAATQIDIQSIDSQSINIQRVDIQSAAQEIVTPKTATTSAQPKGAKAPPAIIQTIDKRLEPITRNMRLLYVAGDCILIVMAAALLIAFWGGAYSEAWKLIALAGMCLYVADMLMIYHHRQSSYIPGSLWEIFWVLSALFFGLGASVEHGVSVQMRQKRSRQQWI